MMLLDGLNVLCRTPTVGLLPDVRGSVHSALPIHVEHGSRVVHDNLNNLVRKVEQECLAGEADCPELSDMDLKSSS